MKVVSCEKIFDETIYELDTDEQVTLDLKYGYWEYEYGYNGFTYCSGSFRVEDGVVIDYDGVFSLPEAVMFCLSLNYKLDL